MNTLIHNIASLGWSVSVYNIINLVSWFIALVFSVWHAKKIGVSFWKAIVVALVANFGLLLLRNLTTIIATAIRDAGFLNMQDVGNSIVRAFVFLPLLMIPLGYILRIKWSLLCDAIVFAPLLTSAFSQLACVFTGCCRGFEADWGIYNIRTESYHVPVQVIETVLTLAIFFLLLYQLSNRNYKSDGMLYPAMMAFYGIMRFVCECLRDNEKIILGCSGVAIHALIMFVAGFAILFYNEKKTAKPIEEKSASAEPPSVERS